MSNSSQYPQLPRSEPPPAAPHSNHGGTPAAWALMVLAGAGAVVGAVGIAMRSEILIIAGAIVVVIGMVVSIVLRVMGKGQPPLQSTAGSDDELAHLRYSPTPTSPQASPTPAVITQGTEPGSEPSDK